MKLFTRPAIPFSSRAVVSMALLSAVFLCAMLLPHLPCAQAHSVYIFAWADGPRICTQSYFSKSSRVKNGDVRMADSQGTLLQSGQSDADGLICFPPPEAAGDLFFTVNAGQGHRGEFLLPASEVQKVMEHAAAARSDSTRPPAPDTAATAPSSSPEHSSPAAPSLSGLAGSVSPKEPAYPPLSREEARDIIREEMQRQLSPILQALAAEKNSQGPGLRDILGGIGWIFGLAAVGSLYYNRKNSS